MSDQPAQLELSRKFRMTKEEKQGRGKTACFLGLAVRPPRFRLLSVNDCTTVIVITVIRKQTTKRKESIVNIVSDFPYQAYILAGIPFCNIAMHAQLPFPIHPSLLPYGRNSAAPVPSNDFPIRTTQGHPQIKKLQVSRMEITEKSQIRPRIHLPEEVVMRSTTREGPWVGCHPF